METSQISTNTQQTIATLTQEMPLAQAIGALMLTMAVHCAALISQLWKTHEKKSAHKSDVNTSLYIW